MSDCHDFCGFWLKGIWWDANRELKESVIGTEVFTRRCRNRVQAADHSYFWVPIIIRYRNHKNAERSAGKIDHPRSRRIGCAFSGTSFPG